MKHPLRYLAAIAAMIGLYIVLVTLPNFKAYEKEMHQKHIDYYESRYVDPEEWAQGRVCDKLLWKCLPESNDTKRWQTPLKNGLDSFELTEEVLEKSKRIGEAWAARYDAYHSKKHPKGEKEPMLISHLNKQFFEDVEAKRFLIKMEQRLAKEFPGFWRDVDLEVRFRWIQRAMNKAKRFGGDPKLNNEMVELCARIGLDFDKDPKWGAITKFINEDIENNISPAINYIDWTIFGKTYARTGTRITDWLMRPTIGKLPYPKKPYPKLNAQRSR